MSDDSLQVAERVTRPSALVTGASRGIGLAVAASLAAAGWCVAMLARTASALEEAAKNAGNDAFAVKCDLRDPASILKAIETVNTTFGQAPDLIVNNAGLFMIRAVEDSSLGDFTSLLATNLTAPFTLVNAFLGSMRARGSGHVVTIGSVADRYVFPEMARTQRQSTEPVLSTRCSGRRPAAAVYGRHSFRPPP